MSVQNHNLKFNPVYIAYLLVLTALGAGANVGDRKIGALCSSPVEVATQQTFSILMPIMKGALGA